MTNKRTAPIQDVIGNTLDIGTLLTAITIPARRRIDIFGIMAACYDTVAPSYPPINIVGFVMPTAVVPALIRRSAIKISIMQSAAIPAVIKDKPICQIFNNSAVDVFLLFVWEATMLGVGGNNPVTSTVSGSVIYELG